MINEVIQGVLKGTGKDLIGKMDGNELVRLFIFSSSCKIELTICSHMC